MKVDWFTKGQSILEVILSITLISLIFTGLFFLFNQSLIFEAQTENERIALELARNTLEDLKIQAATNFNSLQSSTETKDNFTIIKNIENIDGDTKKVKVKVIWQEFNQTRNFELTTLLTNWRNITTPLGGSSGGSGGTGPSGDWRNPVTLSSIDLGPGNAGTDILVRGKTVFISSIASDRKKPDLFVIDVSNPSSPFLKAQLDTGVGVNSLALSTNYLYLAQNSTNNQLQIVNIVNESNPSLISQISLFNNNQPAVSIFYYNNYVFIGSKQANGPELQIFNVSNPNNPTFISSLKIGADVNDIFVKNNLLYLATSKTDAEIILVDVTTPSNPRIISTKDLTNPALSIFPYGENIILVGTNQELLVINPTNLSLISSLPTYGAVNDIYAKGYLVFLATSNPSQELQIINISNLNNPYLYSYFNFPQMATGIDYLNNLVYISVRSNDALRIVTSR